ncbi:hypothetical protein [Pseudorhodoplanes sp.]|uniref:hypothetical protein n=1 Tax=Pseudorhodoplanes sp. TaxID=1934341 RepID=UPI003D0CABEE
MPANKLAPVAAHNNRHRLSAVFGLMSGVDDVVAYCDTLELFFRGSTIPALGPLRKRLHDAQKGRGKLPRFKPVQMFADGMFVTVGWRFLVNHPSADALVILDDIVTEHRAKVCRLDIALDFVTDTKESARVLMGHFVNHLILRFNRSNGMPDEEFGTYWVRYKEVGKKPTRNVLAYWDRPSKVRRQPCCHVETRFIGSEAVRRMTERFGITLPSDLMGLNPAEFIGHNFILAGTIDEKSLDDLHKRVPQRIARRLTQGYRAGLLHKFKMIEVPRLGLSVLKLPSKMEL